ncbi:hypothetical protein A5638_22640 [Mycolicibacterium fortuitum]|uniref:hypothetical protein n=1 Tax=Mycolicibacterium fortuitum TaxID=1766 RepID=UPI0007EE1966|nr:hypothetical protein [Mycolicibacterium fortuitum]OBJ94963.1 hypothetical protein A5638_22640 [Mycolicibacterium fortuitum]
MTGHYEPYEDDESGLSAFDVYDDGTSHDDDGGLSALDYQYADATSDEGVGDPDTESASIPDLTFSSANASCTVVVTALLNGSVHQVDLSPQTVAMTETELAAEILAVADVAAAKAKSAQYELVSGLLRIQGQDADSIREVVQQRMSLPTPDEAVAAEANLNSRHRRPD